MFVSTGLDEAGAPEAPQVMGDEVLWLANFDLELADAALDLPDSRHEGQPCGISK
ncbi:MAG TPA: hypothetical protein VGU71_10000 [Candidatus Dormibacteraeota bacterium]|nr:hypothetical protein [Candidatus Dormibacteraeota bacterium]